MKQPGLTLRLPSVVLPRIDVKLNGILKKLVSGQSFQNKTFIRNVCPQVRSMELITDNKQQQTSYEY